MCPNENGRYVGISKVKKSDLSGKAERLVEGEWELTSINVYGDYVYFVTLVQNDTDDDDENADEVDNQIHRVKKDGTNHEIINDNEFNNYSYKIAVVDNKVYYIGDDECIWYMNLNGSEKTRLNENASGFDWVSDKYILYNMYSQDEEAGTTTTITYIMDRDGKNSREVTGERLYSSVLYDDYIYYLTNNRYLHRVTIDGKDDEMLSSAIMYNLNVTKNGVFYLAYYYNSDGDAEGLAVYRMDLDGKNAKQLYKLSEESNSLCVLKDWIFYLDSDSDQGRMELLSFDGNTRQVLYKLDYSNYYYLDELTENSEDETESVTEDTTGNIEDDEN
jgi:hypothetical protein